MKFTVLISVYHRENPLFFEEALNSVYNQTLQPDEVLIVKDGKLTQELDAVVDNFKLKYPSITKTLQLEKNVGLGLALKEGVKNSKYDIIARMDSDDICVEDRFEKQIKYLEKNPQVSVLGSWIEEFDTNTGKTTSIRKVKLKHDGIVKNGKIKNPMNHVTVVFRKSDIVKAGGYKDFQIFEDYYLWIRCIQANLILENTEDRFVKVRAGDSMMGRRGGKKYFMQEYKFQKYLYKTYNFGAIIFMRNVIIRCFPRLLPKIVITYLYKISRI